MVYQELDLFPHLTVAENICQGNIPKNKAGMVDWKEMERVSKELLKLIKVDINVNERMDRLSIAQQQIAASETSPENEEEVSLRPQTLDDYIGQTNLKKMLKIYLPLSEI